MKKIISIICLLSVCVSVLCSCGDGEAQTIAEESVSVTETEAKMDTETETEPAHERKPVSAVYPENGAEISLLSDEMTEWVQKYKPSKLDKIYDHTEKCEPVPVVFRWDDDGALYSNVFIADNAEMNGAAVYLCNTPSLTVTDLYTGYEYFWQVVSEYEDMTLSSEVFSFTTLSTPRTVAVDGVSNVRDIGGYKTADGKQIKRGIVYRGADFEHITDKGVEKLVKELGIKTELDLRERSNGGPSPLGEDINYIAVSGPWYDKSFLFGYQNDLLRELRVFVDADNYPVYFHCSLGRDRTGTLAFLLEALCGVSKSDIYMDYEVSFFSDMGGYDDSTAPSGMTAVLETFRKTVQNYAKGKSLYEATRAFLLDLGMTDGELDAIRSNLLEDAG